MTDNVLQVQDLSVDYRTERGLVQALRGVSLSVPKGGIVGIVGESGCGKSTLINAIIRLLAANAVVKQGELVFEGQDLMGLSPDAMRRLRGNRLSMVFQDPMTTLNPVLSIGAQMRDIQYRASISRSEKNRRAVTMLEKVGIPDAPSRLNQYPHEFSGGMRQRIAIAMALLAEPALLIADEPTTALDATLEVQIIHLLQQLQRDTGCAILFISHHLGVIAELCEQVVVMYAGRVVESGPVREIFHRPAHPYTARLLECDPARIPEATRELPTIPGDIPDLVYPPEGCIFRERCHRVFDPCTTAPPRRQRGTQHQVLCHLEEAP